MEKQNSQCEHGQPMEQTKSLFCTHNSGVARATQVWLAQLRCGSLLITTPVSDLANEFDVRSVLYGQVSLAAVSQLCIIHEAMNGFKNLKIH